MTLPKGGRSGGNKTAGDRVSDAGCLVKTGMRKTFSAVKENPENGGAGVPKLQLSDAVTRTTVGNPVFKKALNKRGERGL